MLTNCGRGSRASNDAFQLGGALCSQAFQLIPARFNKPTHLSIALQQAHSRTINVFNGFTVIATLNKGKWNTNVGNAN